MTSSLFTDHRSPEAVRARREQTLALCVLVVPALAVVAAAAAWAEGWKPTRSDWFVFGASTLATMFGAEVGYHRYFTHRAFKARPVLEWTLGILGSTSFLGPVIWWAAMHRRHHLHTDTEGDPHSPHWPHRGGRGAMGIAHVGWVLDPEHTRHGTVRPGRCKT